MSGNIYWLASYPKSGNTWVRAFISALRHASGLQTEALDINGIAVGGHAANTDWISGLLGTDLCHFSEDEILALRPMAYRQASRRSPHPLYVKVHDAFRILPGQHPLFPSEATGGILHIVRNPLDVTISYAHHRSEPLDDTIAHLADMAHASDRWLRRITPQLPQLMLSWSAHTRSWQSAPGRKLLVRYEDMLADSLPVFRRIAGFLGLPDDAALVSAALQACDFSRLREQEQARGFREKPPGMARFFRKGVSGDWRDTLSSAQVERLCADHADVMRALDYLP